MGHRDLLVAQNLSQPTSNQRPVTSRAASAAGRLCSNGVIGNWESDKIPHDDKTYRELVPINARESKLNESLCIN